jgi:Bacterial regulatory proteins, luxR family
LRIFSPTDLTEQLPGQCSGVRKCHPGCAVGSTTRPATAGSSSSRNASPHFADDRVAAQAAVTESISADHTDGPEKRGQVGLSVGFRRRADRQPGLAVGYMYQEIGTRLSISARTVETHAAAVLRKLQLSNRRELSRWAGARRLV